jgi:hypothetical protein
MDCQVQGAEADSVRLRECVCVSECVWLRGRPSVLNMDRWMDKYKARVRTHRECMCVCMTGLCVCVCTRARGADPTRPPHIDSLLLVLSAGGYGHALGWHPQGCGPHTRTPRTLTLSHTACTRKLVPMHTTRVGVRVCVSVCLCVRAYLCRCVYVCVCDSVCVCLL